jgi:hypothetical protein
MLRKSRDRKLVRVVVSRESIQISAMPLTQLMITGAARENREKHEFVNKTKTFSGFLRALVIVRWHSAHTVIDIC